MKCGEYASTVGIAMKKIVVFLGRSVDGIINDVRAHFGEEGEIVIVSRDNDTLTPPEGFQAVPVSTFETEPGVSYIVVANGGTAAQLVPVLVHLTRSGVSLEVYDLQRDGIVKLA
jgi:hypothetical protein